MTRGPYTKMTPDQLKRFAELYAGGVRFEDIAAEFRVALGTVRNMCRRLGLPERKRPPTRRKRTMPATDAVPLPVPPSMPAHPFWSPDRDLAVMATRGRYPALRALAGQMGKPLSAVQQRWHQLRAGSCAMRAARRDAGAVLASPASEGGRYAITICGQTWPSASALSLALGEDRSFVGKALRAGRRELVTEMVNTLLAREARTNSSSQRGRGTTRAEGAEWTKDRAA